MRKNKFLKKHASTFDRLWWLIRIPAVIINLLIIVVIISIALDMHLEIKATESSLLVARLLYSPEGISQVDPISGRVVTGVIDLKNLNDSRIDNGLIITKNDRISARIEVYEKVDYKGKLYEVFLKSAKFNKQYFDAYDPMAEAFYNVGGIGGVFKYEVSYPVLVLKNKTRVQGVAKFKVLIPKSAK